MRGTRCEITLPQIIPQQSILVPRTSYLAPRIIFTTEAQRHRGIYIYDLTIYYFFFVTKLYHFPKLTTFSEKYLEMLSEIANFAGKFIMLTFNLPTQ